METEIFILEILKWAIPTVLGAICGALGMRLKHYRDQSQAIADGVKVLLMARIQQDYEHYIVLDEHMTLNDKEVHAATFAAYEALDGDGVAHGMHEEIMAKQPWVVTD